MRVFDHPNMSNFECPICHTNKDEPVVLVAIFGTYVDGTAEAKQIHLDCLDLTISESRGWIFQEIED
jgi:hypothetical protein